MSDETDARLKRLEEKADTATQLAVGYFIVGPLLMGLIMVLVAAVAWVAKHL